MNQDMTYVPPPAHMELYGMWLEDDRGNWHREKVWDMLPRLREAWAPFLVSGVQFDPGKGWRTPRQLITATNAWRELLAAPPPSGIFADIELPAPWDPELRALTGLIGPPDAVRATIDAHRRAWEAQQQAKVVPARQVRYRVGPKFVPTEVLHIVTAGDPAHYPDARARASAILFALRVLREWGWQRRHVRQGLADPRLAGLRRLMDGRFDHWWRYAARGRRITQPHVWSPTMELPPLEAQWLAWVRAVVDADRQAGPRSTVRHKHLADVVAVAEALARLSAAATSPTFDSSARHLAAEAGVERRHGISRAVRWLSPHLELTAGSNTPGSASAARYRLRPPSAIRTDVQAEAPILEPLWARRWHLRETWVQAHTCVNLVELAERLNAPLAQIKRDLAELQRLDLWEPEKQWGRALSLSVGFAPVMVEADRRYGEQRATDSASSYKRALASTKRKAHSNGTPSTRTRVA